MPWPALVIVGLGVTALLVKAVLERKARYDEPSNDEEDRFAHMIDASSQRDRELQDRGR